MSEVEQGAEAGRSDSYSAYGAEYQSAIRDLEKERIQEHARAIADMMNIRIQDVVLDPPADREPVAIYESDGDYDPIVGEAIRNVLQDNGGTRGMFSQPAKVYDQEGIPDTQKVGYAMEEGTLIVQYRPAEQVLQGAEQPQDDWRVYVSFFYNPLRNYIPKK
jgi:hypothetical protein